MNSEKEKPAVDLMKAQTNYCKKIVDMEAGKLLAVGIIAGAAGFGLCLQLAIFILS